MKVIAVMPAYNSEKTLKRTYDEIPKDAVHEVILVNNASTDRTREIAESIPGLIVINHETNRGYGASQKTCYAEALRRGADVVVMIHSDLQYDPKYAPQMVAPIIAGASDMVFGSRFLQGDPRNAGMHWWRYAGNRFLSILMTWVYGVHLSEFHSGYRAYNRRLLETVPFQSFSNDFAFDSEMIASAVRRKFRISEIPIPTSYHDERSSLSFIGSVKFGLTTLYTLFPWVR
jgi:glycosyltransferase involved in cell wall biosynthesis